MGLGFTIALTLLGAVREFLGTGKIFNLSILPEEYGMLVFVLAPGAFIALGYPVSYTHLKEQAGCYGSCRNNQRTQSEKVKRNEECRNQCDKHTVHILLHAVTAVNVGRKGYD